MAGTAPEGLAVDIGSGGGLPGLVLAILWPESQWLLIDSNGRRASWLQTAIDELGIGSRAKVRCERAELTGRGPLRQTAELVTARGFGPPQPRRNVRQGSSEWKVTWWWRTHPGNMKNGGPRKG